MFYMDTIVQLKMSNLLIGNYQSLPLSNVNSSHSKILFPGCRVEYTGNLTGGPKKGSTGIVLKTGSNKVFVEFDKANNWYISKFLLRPLN